MNCRTSRRPLQQHFKLRTVFTLQWIPLLFPGRQLKKSTWNQMNISILTKFSKWLYWSVSLSVAELLCGLWGWDSRHQESRPGFAAPLRTPRPRPPLWVGSSHHLLGISAYCTPLPPPTPHLMFILPWKYPKQNIFPVFLTDSQSFSFSARQAAGHLLRLLGAGPSLHQEGSCPTDRRAAAHRHQPRPKWVPPFPPSPLELSESLRQVQFE